MTKTWTGIFINSIETNKDKVATPVNKAMELFKAALTPLELIEVALSKCEIEYVKLERNNRIYVFPCSETDSLCKVRNEPEWAINTLFLFEFDTKGQFWSYGRLDGWLDGDNEEL